MAIRYSIVATCLFSLVLPARGADTVQQALQVIGQAGNAGRGSAAASQAAEQLLQHGIEILPQLFQHMDTDNLVSANWCRYAYQQIVARELAKPAPQIPANFLRTYILDSKHQGRARRLAWDLLDHVDPQFREQQLPRLLDDREFREEAVQRVLERANQARQDGQVTEAVKQYRLAFQHARQSSQIIRAADQLAGLKVDVKIIEQMGFINRWYLLGPFDAPEFSGFARRFPPETKVDLAATYPGQAATIGWKTHQAPDRLGQTNLIQAIGPIKEAVGYAYAEIHSPVDQTVQLRCGGDDNMTIWVNDRQVFARNQWLNGTRLDRFSAPCVMQEGTNRILIKICQGPQHKNPAVPNNWSFQIRFCDATGLNVGLKILKPTAAEIVAGKQKQ
ncbi:MAG: hypothetical protein ABGX05_03315 [Pirellulaceae bacterium]